MSKIPVWQMISKAANSIKSDVFSTTDIIKYVRDHFGDVKTGTIRSQVNACTVNLQGRASMPENSKPRIADGKYDFLFSVGRGRFALYDPQKHGFWKLVSKRQTQPRLPMLKQQDLLQKDFIQIQWMKVSAAPSG